MATTTYGRTTKEREVKLVPVLATVGAAGFLLSSLWFGLIDAHVSVGAPPAGTGLSPDARLHAYYTWFIGTLGQERLDTAIAIMAFACLAGVAACVAARLPGDGARVGGVLVVLGSALWIGGNVMQLGGHRAVGLMATHGNPIDATNSIAFTIDTLDDAFELAAFAIMAVGAAMFGVFAGGASKSGWRSASFVLATVLAALAASYVTGPDALVNGLLVIGGIVMVPAWLLLTARFVRERER
jgi:hypothetical protein